MAFPQTSKRMSGGLLILMTVQLACAAFFAADALVDFGISRDNDDGPWHLVIETVAALGLVGAVIFEARLLRQMLQRQAHLEESLDSARAAVHDVMLAHFEGWGLTPSETDIATFLVKGLSIADIAVVRGSAEGTVKSHLNAIYRKSDTRNRGELLSVLIDSMMARDSEIPGERAGDGQSARQDEQTG